MSDSQIIKTTWVLFSLLGVACSGRQAGETSAGLQVPDRAPEQLVVTRAWGPLIVREGEIDAQVERQPWSGSWLPLKSRALFELPTGQLAPLQKYDLYMKRAHGEHTRAAAEEASERGLYDPEALGWEGRCDAWATAAVSEPEPDQPVTLEGVEFSVGDLKDLLIKTYEVSQVLHPFGSNFSAGPGADFNAIYPDQFHRAVQHELVEGHRLLVFDSDPTDQVWNSPLYRVMFEVRKDPADEHLMHVTSYVWGVIPLGVSPMIKDPNYVGSITVNHTYTYDLWGDPQADGSFLVAFGEWTGDSISDHPNFVSVLTGKTEHSSANPEIRTEIVKEILAAARNLHS